MKSNNTASFRFHLNILIAAETLFRERRPTKITSGLWSGLCGTGADSVGSLTGVDSVGPRPEQTLWAPRAEWTLC